MLRTGLAALAAALAVASADPLSHPSAPPRFRLPLVRRPVGRLQTVLGTFVSDFACHLYCSLHPTVMTETVTVR